VVSNVAAVVLETVESIYLVYKDLFHYFANISKKRANSYILR
jgi:hypothetical protein